MTRMLLSKGADPSLIDRRDQAALHIATLYGHLQLVKTLLKYDADVYQRGANGAIPSHIAAREGHIHLIQVLRGHQTHILNLFSIRSTIQEHHVCTCFRTECCFIL